MIDISLQSHWQVEVEGLGNGSTTIRTELLDQTWMRVAVSSGPVQTSFVMNRTDIERVIAVLTAAKERA